jgi:hypothetical protein
MQPTSLTCHHFPCKVPVVCQLHTRINHNIVVPQSGHVMAQQCTLAGLQSHTNTHTFEKGMGSTRSRSQRNYIAS